MITSTEIVELHRPVKCSKYYSALPPILSLKLIENSIIFLKQSFNAYLAKNCCVFTETEQLKEGFAVTVVH